MSSEYAEQDRFEGGYSWFWRWRRRNGKWGGIGIHRIASFNSRGGVVRVTGYAARWQDGRAPFVDVYVSDAGQSVRVYLNGRTELVPIEEVEE